MKLGVSHPVSSASSEDTLTVPKWPDTRTKRMPFTGQLWKTHDLKAKKTGQRGTIYWVGKSIVTEDGRTIDKRTPGASYRGEWDGDKKNGYGVQCYPNGDKYEGQWEDGLRQGEGTYWVPIGKVNKLRKVYVGGWKDDKRHGRGTCFFKSGELFQGTWENGRMHGRGSLRYANGDIYIGEFHDGLRSGAGTLNKANGDCYEGSWLDGKREGSGSYFYADSGKVFVGEWAADMPKTGVYTEANSPRGQLGTVPAKTILPSICLAKPADVLEGALKIARNNRKYVRTRTKPISQLFDEEELAVLKAAFMQVQQADATVTVSLVLGIYAELGLDVPRSRLQRTLAAANYTCDDDATLKLEDFVRLIALIIDEEKEAYEDLASSQAEPMNEPWATDSNSDVLLFPNP